MLELNISNLLSGRGVDNACRYLMQNGIKYHVANRLLNGKVENISYARLEELCLVCSCTPDDLFVWKPDPELKTPVAIPEDHPLYKLKPKAAVVNPVDRVKNLSAKKLAKLKEFMDGLEKES